MNIIFGRYKSVETLEFFRKDKTNETNHLNSRRSCFVAHHYEVGI